jgi:type I restriction enzyme S subunit
MTELGPLPEEWEVVMLGDVAEVSSGGSAPQGDEYFKGSKPFVRVSHIDNEDYTIKRYDLISDKAIQDYRLKLFPKGTIVFPKSGATIYLEKRAMLPMDAYVVSHLCTVLSKREDLNQYFLFYVLRNLKLAKEKADGYPTLNISEIKQILIPLPPLSEQKKIAAILSAIQEAKEKTEAVISATRDLKKSMMSYLFTYGPVPLPEAENVPLKETEVGMIPEEWEVVNFSEIGKFQYGYTESGSTVKIGPKFLRITDIDLTSGNINWSSVPYCKISDVDYPKYELYEGDILIARIGATTGKTCIIKNPPKSVFASYLIRFIYDKEKVDPFFIYYFTNSHEYWVQVNASKEGKLKKGVSSSQLKNFRAPLPPLLTQQKIASILSAIDEKIEAEEDKKKALEDLFKTLLHNLMTAKIRVNNLEVGV